MRKHRRKPVDEDYPLFRQLELEPPKIDQLLTVDEIYARASQDLLERLKEDRRIERKPSGHHAEALGPYFSMWANTSPEGGLLVIGMEDGGTTSGCRTLSQKQLNRLEQTDRLYCPDARCESKRLAVVTPDGNEDFVVIFRVDFRADKLVRDVRGDAYIRCGDTKRKLSDEEARVLEIDRGQVPFEQDPCSIPYPEGFDESIIRQFAHGYRVMRNLGDGLTDEEILELRHLGRRDKGKFIPNNACAILFAKDPTGTFPGCKVRFQRFDGEREGVGEQYNAVKDEWIEGPAPKLIVETAKVLDAQLRRFKRLQPDGFFQPIAEYPKLAWYEALVNACVHRSYGLRNMNIFVKMFDDRLVIESPGGFPPLVTPENIYEMHHPRNPKLMEAMFYLKFVQCAREGTRRMRETMVAMELPVPEFEQKEAGQALVRVTLRNDIKHRRVWIDFDASSVVGEAVYRTLTEPERQVINYVAEYKKINVSQAMKVVGTTYWHKARNILNGLKQKGILDDHRRLDIDRDSQAYYFLRTTEATEAPERSSSKKGRGKPGSRG
jgi:ATP-dependent DNA helicase RecG